MGSYDVQYRADSVWSPILRKSGGLGDAEPYVEAKTTTTTMLSRNGTRQPQASSCSSDSSPVSKRKAPLDSTIPTVGPSRGKLA